MEKYIYRPVRFYLITFACTWFWWLFAILLNEGTGLYLGMFLGLVSPAVVAVVTVFMSKKRENYESRDKLNFINVKKSTISYFFESCCKSIQKVDNNVYKDL